MLAAIFEHATEGILVATAQGEIIMLNPCVEKLFGYSKDELIGKSIETLLPADIRERHIQHRIGFVKQPGNRTMGAGRDLFAQKKDGTVFPVEVSLSHYEKDGILYVIAFVIDISVRKHIEQIQQMQREELIRISDEVRKLNSSLEQKVEDRTMMLRETLAQLENSKQELEAALEKEKELSDLKSRFVSTVSHEFRTPLAAVLSSSALISKYIKEEDQPKRERHIGRIKESIKHLSDMLEDLLSLGKLEEGLIQANVSAFICDEFMNDFISEMKNIAKPGQEIILIHSGSNEIVTDKRLLRNILLNLVSNAIKFSPENSIINITCTNSEHALTVSVKDSGIGISDEDKIHLFERFFRARNAQNIQGTGLGLHIVTKYVELLNGKISLTSELDKGTTFTVILPKN